MRMSRLYFPLFLFLFLFTGVYPHTPLPCLKENKYLVKKPVLSLYEEPSEKSSFVTQTIYGHQVYLVEKLNEDWAIVETEDNYRGYAKVEGLILDNPRWRTSKNLCRTKSIASLVYSIPDTEKPALLRLPFDSRLELVQSFDSSDDRWLEVILIDGKKGWVQRGDLEILKAKSLEDVVALSRQFSELPYTWGGTSSEGFDCSGYVQTLFKQMGVLLPRDSRPQAASEKVNIIDNPGSPGDLVFFGSTKIIHVGVYLGDGNFIHSGVWHHNPKITITSLESAPRQLLASCRVKKPVYSASIHSIDKKIKSKITHSWKGDNPEPIKNLRYIQLTHWGFDGYVHNGELIVHKDVAQEVVDIFEELFSQQYPIEKMLLVDQYKANDNLSCEDNNSSAFCSRLAVGKNEWSYHSYGRAIDINTLLNPYHRDNVIIPQNGKEFLDRTIPCRGVITHDDPCYKAFVSRGWKWGGDWMSSKGYVDYQHFYKEM